MTPPITRSLGATVTTDPTISVLMEGAELLGRLRAVLGRYVILSSSEAADAVVLWIAATHAQPSWAHAPRLVIRAPEKRCGKSRLLDIVEATCWQPLITVNASPAAVYRSLGTDDPPTILLDEADTIFGPAVQGANEDLRGLLNAGHQRNRPTIRYDAGKNRVEKIATFAMAALAGIGAMPDTIEDRAVVIRMRRRAPGEEVAPYRERRDGPPLRALAAEVNAWMRANGEALERAAPEMPVEDRAADTWEPLVAVADLAGGTWPERARNACLSLNAERDATTDVPLRVRLLMDCRTAFADAPALPTGVLLERLCADSEAPWATAGARGEGLSAMKLANLLKEYDIRPDTYRFTEGQAKGYQAADFADAWNRYCPTSAEHPAGDGEAGLEGSRPSRTSLVIAGQPRYGFPAGTALAVPSTQPTLDAVDDWYGSSRTTEKAVPALTRQNEAGTAGTASPQPATCITCREPMAFDDGTHTHPSCSQSA
jgi:hypothetical protein